MEGNEMDMNIHFWNRYTCYYSSLAELITPQQMLSEFGETRAASAK